MTPAVSFSSSSLATRPSASMGQLAELSKRQQALSQKLAEASKVTPPPPSSTAADSITREISGVQAQIEQILLEAQLSKLMSNAQAGDTAGCRLGHEWQRSSQRPGRLDRQHGRCRQYGGHGRQCRNQ